MNIDDLEVGDKLHIRYTYFNRINREIITNVSGSYKKTEGDEIVLRDTRYALDFVDADDDDEANLHTEINEFRVPLGYCPVIMCERIFNEELAPLMSM